MRHFIIFFLVCAFYASGFCADNRKTDLSASPTGQEFSISSKKTKTLLKTDFFGLQFDFVHSLHKNHLTTNPGIIRQENISSPYFGKVEKYFNKIAGSAYSIAFEHLYPKHNFW